MVMQMRPQQGTRPPAGSLFASPQRDIAHSFPEYARKALILAQSEMNKEVSLYDEHDIELMCDHATAMVAFVKLTVGPDTPTTVHEAAKQSHILEVSPAIEALFAKHFWHVVLSAYWAGARQAYTESDTPLYARDLANTVDGLYGDGTMPVDPPQPGPEDHGDPVGPLGEPGVDGIGARVQGDSPA